MAEPKSEIIDTIKKVMPDAKKIVDRHTYRDSTKYFYQTFMDSGHEFRRDWLSWGPRHEADTTKGDLISFTLWRILSEEELEERRQESEKTALRPPSRENANR